MPAGSLEVLFYGGAGDRAAVEDADFPAESLRVKLERWADRLPVYYREDSTRGGANPKSHSKPSSNSSSQRFSTNLKPTTRIHHSATRRRPSHRTARRPRPAARTSADLAFEPSSPKVSCFGSVLPETRRKSTQTSPPPLPPEEELVGCWATLVALFRCGGVRERDTPESSSVQSWDVAASVENYPASSEWEVAAPPLLGGTRRLASGRRAASWAEGLAAVAAAEEEERVWARRSVGSLEDAQWESEGSASV